MRLETKKRLLDILEAACAAERHGQSLSADLIEQPSVHRDAIYWQLVIIGEALSAIRREDPDTAEQITDSHRIIGFRNQLVHGYGTIRHGVAWEIVSVHLSVLIAEVRSLLGHPS